MLDFANLVHQHFDALAAQHKMSCLISNNKMVRFEGEKTFLQVRFDAGRSFEIGVEIGEKQNSAHRLERPFNLAEILRLKGVSEIECIECLQASKSKVLSNAVELLSNLVTRYANSLLDGTESDFIALAKLRDRECTEYAYARDLRYARSDAEKAWENKNYVRVVNAYKPFITALMPSEKKRLTYAEKKIKSC